MNKSDSLYVMGGTNFASVLVCSLAAMLVLCFKLYKMAVYRLALYQVLASLAFATAQALQIIFVYYDQNSEDGRVQPLCTAMGWLVVYTSWMKLLFTMWVTFHVFCFAVLHKNLKKLEALYVLTSLLVPVLIAAIPLMTGTYGRDHIGACWIEVDNNNSDIQRLTVEIETYALWDGPAMIILVAASIAMFVMVTKLAHTACRRSTYRALGGGDTLWKAIKHLLPLAAFPILFFVFEIPVFIFHVYADQRSRKIEDVLITAEVCLALWSMASGVALIAHISVVKICSKKHKAATDHNPATTHTQKLVTWSRTGITINCDTRFSLPPASV